MLEPALDSPRLKKKISNHFKIVDLNSKPVPSGMGRVRGKTRGFPSPFVHDGSAVGYNSWLLQKSISLEEAYILQETTKTSLLWPFLSLSSSSSSSSQASRRLRQCQCRRHWPLLRCHCHRHLRRLRRLQPLLHHLGSSSSN